MNKLFHSMCGATKKVHFVDKCLIVIMGLLLFFSGINVFLPYGNVCQGEHIDVIIRTLCATIFGYFISANFAVEKSSVSTTSKPVLTKTVSEEAASTGKKAIGFESADSPVEMGEIGLSANDIPTNVTKLQVAVTAAIGVFSIVMLFLLRNFVGSIPDCTATIAQLRDFALGGIGFLIGCSKNKRSEN
ncbi:MAG: hypothetical protein Q4C12_03260 [Clostridia bacterium]|nr:hypothetical protein [Clostridia bacterium]